MKRLLLVTFWIVLSVHCTAQEPKQDWVPAPKAAGPIVIYEMPDRPPLVGQRNVWELLAVDSSGRFRPRVAPTPYGTFYLYNGRPYPGATVNTLPFMPYAVD